MNCPKCHKVLEEGWKVCPFCPTIPSPLTEPTNTKYQDSIHTEKTEVHNSGGTVAGSVIVQVGSDGKIRQNRKPELVYEEYILTVLKSGGSLNKIRPQLDELRARLELTLGQSKSIEEDCLKPLFGAVSGMEKSEPIPEGKTIKAIPHPSPPPNSTNSKPSSQQYLEFFSDLRKMFGNKLNIQLDFPNGKRWYLIPTGITDVHFEWMFEFRIGRLLGVELHFETRDKRWNEKMLAELSSMISTLERETGEKVLTQKEWGKYRNFTRIYLIRSDINMNDDLKQWAIQKMLIFYQILQPRLRKLV